jgi:formylglycine-generating enzyme required for sulfatase activity
MCCRNPVLGMRIMICISLILSCSTSARDKSDKAATDYVVVGESQIALVKIPAGTFQMGTAQVLKAEDDWDNDVEHPVHEVRITKTFWMGEFSVTQREWQGVMGNNPSYCRNAGPDAPVEQVSWNDAQAFITKVNGQQTRWTVRLPTEAEWEYASRAGTTGETYGPLDDIAWYKGNNSGSTHPVGQKAPNAFGLYDMLGNVWQWCQDWFAPYTSASLIDPQGAPTGEKRVMKGGCFYCAAIHCRAARRNRDPQDHLSRSIGFRIVAEARTGPSG